MFMATAATLGAAAVVAVVRRPDRASVTGVVVVGAAATAAGRDG
jgi:hypothetical protein